MRTSRPRGPASGALRLRLALALGSLLVALLLVELGARLYLGERFVFGAYRGPPQQICGVFDPDLGWANRPDTSVDIAAPGFRYHVTINSRGARGPERDPGREPEPAPGVVRIVVLGDSTSWGWGVDDDQTWPRYLEARLGPRVEVINLAVPGYGTDQELWMLEREGLAWRPDIVLVGLVLNDLQGNRFPVMHHMQKPHYVRGAAGEWELANHPAQPAVDLDISESRRSRRVLGMYLATLALGQPPAPEHVPLALDDPEVQQAIRREFDRLVDPEDVTPMLLGRIRDLCLSIEARPLVFLIPHLHDRYLYDREGGSMPKKVALWSGPEPFRTYGSLRLAEAGRRFGFETLSLDQALLDAVRSGEHLDCGDEHLNPRGNRIVADTLAATLAPLVEELLAGR